MKLHQVLTGATNTFDDKAAIAVGSVDDHPFTVQFELNILITGLRFRSENNEFRGRQMSTYQ